MITRHHKPTPRPLNKKGPKQSSDSKSKIADSVKEGATKPAKTKGLGDRVEKIAQPIAKIVDKIAGTNVQGCGACKRRKEYLNKKFPNT